MCVKYLAKFLLYVGVDVDVIHTVRHFPLARRCPLGGVEQQRTSNNETERGNQRPRRSTLRTTHCTHCNSQTSTLLREIT